MEGRQPAMQNEVLFAPFKNEATAGALGNTLQGEYSTADALGNTHKHSSRVGEYSRLRPTNTLPYSCDFRPSSVKNVFNVMLTLLAENNEV